LHERALKCCATLLLDHFSLLAQVDRVEIPLLSAANDKLRRLVEFQVRRSPQFLIRLHVFATLRSWYNG
jgi:hypothetical protein